MKIKKEREDIFLVTRMIYYFLESNEMIRIFLKIYSVD